MDRILAGLIAVLAIGSCQLVLRRLGAVGEFWHVHLVAVIAWVAALSILKFGTRAAARTRVAWFYLFVCFPPIFLLTGQALGGSLLAYGALTALYGAVAMFLALRQQDIRWVVAPIYFGLAFAGTYLLRNGVVPLAYLLPNAVLTLLTITLFVRAPRERGRADIPRHSLLTVAVVIALSALVGLAPKQPVTHTPRSDLMWVRADWVNGLHNAGIAVGAARRIRLGSTGDGRPRLGGPIPASLGAHRSLPRCLLDPGIRPAHRILLRTLVRDRTPAGCGKAVHQLGRRDQARSPRWAISTRRPSSRGDPAWHAHHWLWRTRVGSAVVYQAVYLIASRDPEGSGKCRRTTAADVSHAAVLRTAGGA